MRIISFLVALLLASCGYHFDGGEKISISVPYVIGDYEGELTEALIRAISRTPNFRYAYGQGDWTLKAKIVDVNNDRIGYVFDREPLSGKLLKNLIGIENRKSITVEISVVNSLTGESILGPQLIKGSADYDYDDPNSFQDLSFINPTTGLRDTSIAFSLGQLDSVSAAGEDAIYPIYNELARKIINGLIAAGAWNGD